MKRKTKGEKRELEDLLEVCHETALREKMLSFLDDKLMTSTRIRKLYLVLYYIYVVDEKPQFTIRDIATHKTTQGSKLMDETIVWQLLEIIRKTGYIKKVGTNGRKNKYQFHYPNELFTKKRINWTKKAITYE